MEGRVIPVDKVAALMQNGLKSTFQCTIDFYKDGLLIFTFFDHGDDMVTIRVLGDKFSVINRPRITARNMIQIAGAFKRAHDCMGVLHVTPAEANETEL